MTVEMNMSIVAFPGLDEDVVYVRKEFLWALACDGSDQVPMSEAYVEVRHGAC